MVFSDEEWERFYALRQRVFDSVRKVDDGYHKSYEGAVDIRICFANIFEGDGLRYEIADFFLRIQGYPGRDAKLLPEESIWMAGVMEDFLRER